MVVSVNARSAGKLTINVLATGLLTTQTTDVKEGTAKSKFPSARLGTGALCGGDAAPPLDAAALPDAGRAIGLNGSASTRRSHARGQPFPRRWCVPTAR